MFKTGWFTWFMTGCICCSLFACGQWSSRQNRNLMQQAQLLLEQLPDSALTLLDAVNPTSLGNAEKAEYTLLRVQAKDKAERDIAADTAIFNARDYYVAAKNGEKAVLACFYAGRVLQEQGDANAAMQAYLDAERMANPFKNHDRIKGLIDFYTGQLYYDRIEITEAVAHYRKAANHFKMAGDEISEMYTWNSIGCAHLVNEAFDSALYYYHQVTEIPAYQDHQKMQAIVMQNIGIISRCEEDYPKARDLFLQALRQNRDEQIKARLYICLAQAYQGLYQLDSTKYYVDRALELCEQIAEQPIPAIYETMIQMEESRGNYREALQYARKKIEYERNTYDKYLEQQLSEAERKYNYEAVRNQNHQLTIQRKNELILFLSILTGCLVVVVVLFNMSLRWKKTISRKNRAIDLLTHQADEHRQQVACLREEIERHQEIIQQLKDERTGDTKENNETIDAKIKAQEEHVAQLENQIRLSYALTLKTNLDIFRNYERFKKGLDMDKHGRTIDLVNRFFYGEAGAMNWESIQPLLPGNLEEKIKKEYGALNTNEVRLCCLILFDVDKKYMLRILPLSEKSCYTIKCRIKQKIGAEDIPKALAHFLQ